MTFQKLLGLTRKAVNDFNLIEDGDRVCVGLSGGKDSMMLMLSLARLREFSDRRFTLCAVMVDMGYENLDRETLAKIEELCREINVPLEIVKTNIGEVVFDIKKETNPCSLCANMRRGALNRAAKRLNCNKVALAHNADDLIETFMMSLSHEGRLSTLQAKSYLSECDMSVIRPLIYVDEKWLYLLSRGYPILKNPCPVNHKTERERMKELVERLDKEIPSFRKCVFTALVHPERNNLLDTQKVDWVRTPKGVVKNAPQNKKDEKEQGK